MALVDYSDSDEDFDPPPAKRIKSAIADGGSSVVKLPPLPAAFRDLYSTTVRTSTEDDPSLHAGRTRLVPHVTGNWSAHIYLEWCPKLHEYALLSRVISQVSLSFAKTAKDKTHVDQVGDDIHSLLTNDLDVRQPLHVSLSRPLVLRTEEKDDFLLQLSVALAGTNACIFSAKPLNLRWHPNEDRSRWFLVLHLQRPPTDELRRLLKSCNAVSSRFAQPTLYQDGQALPRARNLEITSGMHDSFHVSIAWSLHPHDTDAIETFGTLETAVDLRTRESLHSLSVCFSEVKARIGQHVSSFPLRSARAATT